MKIIDGLDKENTIANINTKVENNVITTDIENAKIVTIKLHR